MTTEPAVSSAQTNNCPQVRTGCDVGAKSDSKDGHQLGVVSFSHNGFAYYLAMIEDGPQDAVSFRGMRVKSNPTPVPTVDTEILNFHIRGPLISSLGQITGLREFGMMRVECRLDGPDESTNMSASAMPAVTPFYSTDGKSPHGGILFIDQANHPRVDVTLADFQEGLGIIEAFVIVACVSILTTGAPQIITALKGGAGTINVGTDVRTGKITTTGSFSTGPGSASAAPIDTDKTTATTPSASTRGKSDKRKRK